MEEIYVYMHKNIINNKVYIGQTNNYKKRWRSNGYEYKPKKKNCSRFWNAIQKYGWDNFEHIILKKCQSREEANYWEIYYIKLFNSQNEEYGYNINSGGKGTPGYWESLSDEEKELRKIQCSQRAKELWKNQQYVERQKEGMRKVFESKEYSEKMSESLKQTWSNPELREEQKEKIRKIRGTPVMCIETQQVFNSISAANEYFNKSTRSTAIHDFFRNKQKTAFGYTWKKLTREEYNAITEMESKGKSNNNE